MAAYATITDLIDRFDVRVIQDLVTDDGEPVSRADVMSHSTALNSLVRASGAVDVALRSGQRYTPDQLSSLDENSAEHLKDIVCTIAMDMLFRRRPGVHEEIAEQVRKRADSDLKQLRDGVNVFGIVDDTSHLDAGTIDVHGPTSVEITDRNFLAARMSGRHLPHVSQSQPHSRG